MFLFQNGNKNNCQETNEETKANSDNVYLLLRQIGIFCESIQSKVVVALGFETRITNNTTH